MQNDYTLVPYEKSIALRQELQKGLFIMSKRAAGPLPIEWFDKITIELGDMETLALKEYLYAHNYTAENLLPEVIGGINVCKLAYSIKAKYSED
ncbi:MAG: hypothetical protein EOM66_03150 [Clostridia bacterium]|nr:hypothetical protein [Clostridia bacterium]